MSNKPNQMIVRDHEPNTTMKTVGIGASLAGLVLLVGGAVALANYSGECKGYRNGFDDCQSTIDMVNRNKPNFDVT